MVVLIEFLEISHVDLLQVINELFAHLVDCQACFDAVDQAINIIFIKWFNTFTNLSSLLLFKDCLTSDRSGDSTIATL